MRSFFTILIMTSNLLTLTGCQHNDAGVQPLYQVDAQGNTYLADPSAALASEPTQDNTVLEAVQENFTTGAKSLSVNPGPISVP